MQISFADFVKQCKQKNDQPLLLFFKQAEFFLIEQLTDYLALDTTHNVNLSRLIEQAKRTQHQETDAKFWCALLALQKTNLQGNRAQKNAWLKFINIIEQLQGYSGAKLFAHKSIKHKRVHRLYFAFMLAWEHLVYMTGKDEGYSPSAEILAQYSDAHLDDEHHH